MASLPPRDSRVLQTVDLLQQEIFSGALQGDIPGERELARRLRVGRVTLRAALKLLEEEGWITPTKAGSRRQTSKHSSKQKGLPPGNDCRGKVVVTFSTQSLEDLPGNERLDFARLNSYCSSAGITLRHRSLDVSKLKRPAYRLSEFIKQNPADLYLLQLANAEVQQWFFKRKIPCVVLGSVWPDCDLPCVDYDQRALGLHAASTLARLSHHKVGMLYPFSEKRGLQLFLDGFSAASADVELSLARHDESQDSVLRALMSLVSDPDRRPSAIILPRVPYVITAISVLPESGIKIPRDISLLCLVYDEALRYSYPQVAGYHMHSTVFPKAMFDLVVKTLRHPDTHHGESSLVMPDFISADSLVANLQG